MIRKSGSRFSEEIMIKLKSMIRKSGSRFSEEIMIKLKSMIRKSVLRACCGVHLTNP